MMDAPFIVILIAGAALLAVVIITTVRRYQKARTEALRFLAQQMGFEVTEKMDGLPEPGLDGFQLFGKGGSRGCRNVMRGRIGQGAALLFDFTYVISTGKSTQVVTQTVAAIGREGGALPRFDLRPETVFHKIGQVFGFHDVDFQEDSIFSRKFLLRGEDENALRTLFPGYLRDELKRREGWSLEGAGDWLVAYRAGKRWKPEELRRFLEEVSALRDMMRT